jgi:hypothetical protein
MRPLLKDTVSAGEVRPTPRASWFDRKAGQPGAPFSRLVAPSENDLATSEQKLPQKSHFTTEKCGIVNARKGVRLLIMRGESERVTRLELATSTLARLHSTN